jgi:hypothetical protein
LQNATNNLPNAFTDYKGVIKSWHHVVNPPEKSGGIKENHSGPFHKEEGEDRNH